MIPAWREHPGAPVPGTRVCRVSDIPDGEGREFRFGPDDDPLRVLIVRREDCVWGYRNRCPHQFIPLNDQPDRFVTYDHEWIVCSTHGAVFRYEDGFCEDGPCNGRSLEVIAVNVVGDDVLIADD